MKQYFPIVIFAYNRPLHLSKVLKSISNSKGIKNHEIYLFCDGPKNSSDTIKIAKIKKLIKKKRDLKFFKLKFRAKNIGLANNIILSLNEVFNHNTGAIIIEDDIVLSKNAINFINFYLNNLKNYKKIGSVSAFSYLDNYNSQKKIKYYLSKRHSSWAWGTWSNVWKKIKWNSLNYKKSNEFSDLGKDMNLMLWAQTNNYINSWAIRFNYFCFLNNLKSFQPRYSMINNIGIDGSGTHGFARLKNFEKKIKKRKIKFDDKILLNSEYNKIDNFIKLKHRKSFRLIFLFLICYLMNFLKR